MERPYRGSDSQELHALCQLERVHIVDAQSLCNDGVSLGPGHPYLRTEL